MGHGLHRKGTENAEEREIKTAAKGPPQMKTTRHTKADLPLRIPFLCGARSDNESEAFDMA